MKDISDIVGWLDEGARSAPGERLLEELCSRLAAPGIPLDRSAIFVTMSEVPAAAQVELPG
jgi:hypothetical protein